MTPHVLSEPTEEAGPARRRRGRSCFWRLAVGLFGLAWVGVLLLLMR
ncbi:MAG TPA: hypothetical protein VFS49_06895 [Croceibacterium sp.]|nr:hypothetical protein [Croceibacterium sp.]